MGKIVLIGPVYPYKGGISHYTTLMCRVLREHHEVEMISYKMQYPKILFRKEQKDYSSDSFRLEGTQYLLNTANPFNIYSIARKIVKMKPDAVVIQWWHPYFAPCYRILSGVLKRKRIPIIYICHNVFPHERFPMDRMLTRMTMKRGSGYIVHSSQDRDDLLGILPDASYIQSPHPTYNVFRTRGMDSFEARKILGEDEKRPLILFFGFVREYKGLKVLIEAFPKILENISDARLYVVGDFGSDKEEYLGMIRDRQLEDHVVIRDGYVPDGEVEPYFAGCDLVALPYLSATQSGIVQIAYGFEKPVVVTNVGGLPDVVLDGQTGYVTKAGDPGAFADAVIRYFEEEKAQEFAGHIREEARKYSWELMAERIDELIERCREKIEL